MRRKIKAVLLIAVLMTAVLIPTGFTAADGTDPVMPDNETVMEATEEKAKELFEEQQECEYSQDNTPALEEPDTEPEQEIIDFPAEQTDEEAIAETGTVPFEEESISDPEEAWLEIDYTKDAGENEDFMSGYAQVLSAGAEVYDSNSDDRSQTDRIVSGVVYVLERERGSRGALRIVYLQTEGLKPATGWISAKQVRPMDPETEVIAYLEQAGKDAHAVRCMSSVLLTPAVCGLWDEAELTVEPEDETAENAAGSAKARVTADNVNLRTAPGTEDSEVIMRCATGTKILVLDSIEMNDGIWLQVRTKESAGWLRGDFTDYSPSANEPAKEDTEQALTEVATPCEPAEAAITDETAEVGTPCEPAEAAMPDEPAEVGTPCEPAEAAMPDEIAEVGTPCEPAEAAMPDETAEVGTPCEPAEAAMPGESAECIEYEAEILAWAVQTDATDEMIQRARNAKSLDSMVLEDEKLIYVRTGETVAIFDAASGILFDINSALPVAKLDISSGMLYPLDNEG